MDGSIFVIICLISGLILLDFTGIRLILLDFTGIPVKISEKSQKSNRIFFIWNWMFAFTPATETPLRFHETLLSLTKLMVSHDLLRSTITNRIACDQRDLRSTPKFERAMDHRCQALVPKLET